MSRNSYDVPHGLWGDAVTYTRIDEEGKMWIGNGEYESQVNYCPVTGQMAPKQMKRTDEITNSYNGFTKIITKYINE